MNFYEQTLNGRNICAKSFPEGENAFILTAAGRERLRLGRVACRGFAGALALPNKARLHYSGDGLSARFENAATLPFGCEFLIAREIAMMDRFGWFTTDVQAAERGAVGNVDLESVTFPGPLTALQLLIYGETAERNVDLKNETVEKVWYQGSEPPLLLVAAADDGVNTAFGCGFDLWRHRAASRIEGVTAEFTVKGGRDGVTLTRRVLIYGDGVEPEKRPWRFCGSFAFQLPGDRRALAEPGIAKIALPGGCFEDQKVLQNLTKCVRRAAGRVVAVTESVPAVCTDASHLDRAGKGPLEHWDVEERMRACCRANKELAKRGGAFALALPAEAAGILAENPMTAALARFPEPFDAPEE